MKIFVAVVCFFSLVSTFVHAEESVLNFKVKVKSDNTYDYVSLWNEEFLTASIRTNLILEKLDESLKNKIIGVSKNQPVSIEVPGEPDFFKACADVKALNFEYVPGLPEYLTFITLMGTGCKSVGEQLIKKRVKIKFVGEVSEVTKISTVSTRELIQKSLELEFHATENE